MTYKWNKTWRLKNPKKRYAGKKKYYKRMREFDRNRNRRYTPEEEEMIEDSEMVDRQLAKQLGRSVFAIQIKRNKLKKIGLDNLDK